MHATYGNDNNNISMSPYEGRNFRGGGGGDQLIRQSLSQPATALKCHAQAFYGMRNLPVRLRPRRGIVCY